MPDQPTADTAPSQEPALRFPNVPTDTKLTGPHVLPSDPDGTRYRSPPTDPDSTAYRIPSVAVASGGHGVQLPCPFGDYELLEELGRGGMGVVYKALQVKLKRVVALKMVLAGSHADKNELDRLRAEAAAVARMQHPHIVQVFEVGEVQGLPFFSMEYVEGGSLASKLDGTPWLSQPVARFVEVLARAMNAAHRCGIVHRDLKPANVMLARTDSPQGLLLGHGKAEEGYEPKVTDFGLAKRLDEGDQTRSGVILGTPSYMSPEQARGKVRQIGPAVDVYALGAILYELLTGRPPFRAATAMDTVLQVITDDPVPPSRLQPKLARDLETICLKCIAKLPNRRYSSAEALADDLKRFLTGEPIQARRVGRGERAVMWVRRRPAAAALIGVLIAVGLALPVAALQFSAQLAQRHQAEQKRLDEARAEVHDLHSRGQTASRSQDWKQAEQQLDRALAKIDAEPALEDLRRNVEAVRIPVKDRLNALDRYRHFVRDRDEALFHATLATGESFQISRDTARARAQAALAGVGFSFAGQGALTLEPFLPQEKAEITTGSYALLLMLAETEARRLPGQSPEEHRLRLRQALALLDRADALGVRTRAIHLRRARYLTELGDKEGADKENGLVKSLAAETDLDPQDHFLVGHELYSQGQLVLANQELRRALQLDAGHFWTHYFLGICSVISAKPEVAVAHLTICQSKQPDLIWIYLLRGFALGQMEDYASAENDFDRALALKPNPATLYVLYNNRGVMRVGRKEAWAKGVADLKQAAELRPDQYQALASLSEAYRLAGRLNEAGEHLNQAIGIAGQQVRAGDLRQATLALLHYSRARLRLQRHDREAAVRDFAEAARLAENDRPLRARAEGDRGLVLHLQERFEEALAAYGAALQADPGRVDILRRRGEVLLVQRTYQEAVAAFDAFLEKGGEASAAVFRQRGLAHAKLGRHVEAIDDYGRALESRPKEEDKVLLHLSRGQEYLTLNALQPALRDFEEALRLDPNRPDAYLGCAHVRVKLGEIERGLADADQIVKGKPTDPRLWHGAARVYAQAANMKIEPGHDPRLARIRYRYQEQAVVLLRTALDLVPAEQLQAYWQENVMKDGALAPIRGFSGFVQLRTRFGGPDRSERR